MSAEFRTPTQTINATLDTHTAGSATTTNFSSQTTCRLGVHAMGASLARVWLRFPLGSLVDSLGFNAQAVLNIGGDLLNAGVTGGTILIRRVLRARAVSLVEAAMTDATYNGTNSYTTGRTNTNGGSADPGHDTTATHAVTGIQMPTATIDGLGAPARANVADISDLTQDQLDEIISGSYTGDDAVLGLLLVQENEAAGVTGHGCFIASKENAIANSQAKLLLSYCPAGSDEFLDANPRAILMGGRSVRLFAFAGPYAGWESPDTLRYEYSVNSDMSDSSLTDPIDLSAVSEGDLLAADVTFPGEATTVYFRAVTNAPVECRTPITVIDLYAVPEPLTVATPLDPAAGHIVGPPHGRRIDHDSADIHLRPFSAFDEGDFAYATWGELGEALTNCSDPVPLPQVALTPFTIHLADIPTDKRVEYKVHFVVGGTVYADETGQIAHVPDAGETVLVLTSDLHALSAFDEETGDVALTGTPSIYEPQTSRSQMRDLAYAEILKLRTTDGKLPHARIDLGDHFQSKMASHNPAFPRAENLRQGTVTSASAVSSVDAMRMAYVVAGTDPTLRYIPFIVRVRGNHDAAHPWFDGNDSSLPGHNTLDPLNAPRTWVNEAVKATIGEPDGTGIYGGGATGGEYGYIDYPDLRVIWYDVYKHSQTSGDPNDLSQTWANENDLTIGGEQYDWLFNASNGVYTTCEKKKILLLAHNKTATRVAGGPTRYAWSGWRVASPKGELAAGEFAGTEEWRTADRYGYSTGTAAEQLLHALGFHKSCVVNRPANCVVVHINGHSHQAIVERPHDGFFNMVMPRISGGQDDLVIPGVYSQGHILQGASSKSFADEDRIFRANNGGFVELRTSDTAVALRFHKVWTNFAGQSAPAFGSPVPVDPAWFAIGTSRNSGPNAIASPHAVVYEFLLALPEHPLPAFSDSFGADCVIEDTVAQVTAGTEQDPLNVGEANRHVASNRGAHWKHYSSDGNMFLAVRDSVITPGTNVLSAKRPEAAEAGYVVQGMRRRFLTVDRRIKVDVRQQDITTPVIIRLGGGDVNIPTFILGSWVANGYGLFLAGDGTGKLCLGMDDGEEFAVLAEAGGTVLTAEEWATIDTTIVNGKVTVKADGATVLTYTLSAAHKAWFADSENSAWVGLTTGCDNITDQGSVTEFLNWEAGEASALGGRNRHRSRRR